MNKEIIVIIAGAALVTYLTRLPLMLIWDKWEIPEWLKHYMSFIAPAIITALIAPTVFLRQGKLDISISNEYILATVITVLAAYFSKNALISLLTGVCAISLLMYCL